MSSIALVLKETVENKREGLTVWWGRWRKHGPWGDWEGSQPSRLRGEPGQSV